MLADVLKRVDELRHRHPGYVIGLKIGYFWEFFGDDAVKVSKALGLTITVRRLKGDPVPMCGFPYHQEAAYFRALAAKGIKNITETYKA